MPPLQIVPEAVRSHTHPSGSRHAHVEADLCIQPDTSQGPRDEAESSQSPQQLSPSKLSPKDAAVQERASEMQLWWDEAIAKNMNLPDGYQSVSVLMIKWADRLDELKTQDECKELKAVFEEQFHYKTKVVELNDLNKPQHQLNSHLHTFVNECDGPNNLMIVYYTGHGVYREDKKYLELSASRSSVNKDTRANWNKAEEVLRGDDVDGDVLTILDTCFSSNPVAKSGQEDARTYELLSACSFDTTTAAPGKNSFTRALIDALKELLKLYRDRSFTTFHLNQHILFHPNRRDTPSQLWYRLRHHERHIRLRPLKELPKEQPHSSKLNSLTPPPGGYLTLRFALRDAELNREQIEFLTRQLADALNNKKLIGLKKIDWISMKPSKLPHFERAGLAMRAVYKWKDVVRRRRQERKKKEEEEQARQAQCLIDIATEKSGCPASVDTNMVMSPLTRKRTRDESLHELPEPKRELLGIPPHQASPPSPPVSDSAEPPSRTAEA